MNGLLRLLGAVLGALTPLMALPAIAGADPMSWQVVSSPNPSGTGYAQLTSVSCPTGSYCNAVGYSEDAAKVQAPLIETWDGTSWQIASYPVPSPNYDAPLSSVSCSGSSFCAAVGYWVASSSSASIAQPLIEMWDGTSWQIVAAPEPSGATGSVSLYSVSCTSTTSCTAVGASQPTPGGGPQTLVEVWDGTSWQIASSPNPSLTFNSLSGVSCVSPSNCSAVGVYNNPITTELPLTEAWNGTSWSVVTSPLPSGGNQGYLGSVSCVSSSFCMATGETFGTSSHQSLVEVWNGTSWQTVTSPTPGPGSVSCVSSTDCTAPSTDSASFLTWDGTTWQSVPAALTSTGNPVNLFGISCVSASECTAVGIQPNGAAQLTLVESTSSGPPAQTPEVPIVLLLPLVGLGLLGGFLFVNKRKSSAVSA